MKQYRGHLIEKTLTGWFVIKCAGRMEMLVWKEKKI